jgi:NodT family efflux transporter outer membrane factor (OMF) lipoprotein
MLRFSTANTFIIALCSVCLTGCMVGPDFKSPTPPKTKTYTEFPSPKKTVGISGAGSGGKSQQFVSGKDIPAKWWSLFHSPALDQLIRVGLVNSPTLAAAEANLRQAQELLNAQIGSTLYPSVNAQIPIKRQRLSSASFGSNAAPKTFTLYGASVNIAYTFDLFGGARRGIEAQQAQVHYAAYILEAAHLTLTSNIVITAIRLASLRDQIQATHQLIRSQEEQLKIVNKQFKLGGVSGADVFSQEGQLAQTRATLPPLEKQWAQSRHALSVLIGAFPSESNLPEFELDKLHLPRYLPVSLPSSLVRQRPDIRAQEALLHAASAQIGVATANLYPQITLSGSYGQLSTSTSNLFSGPANVWSFGGQLLQPIFSGGALQAQRRAAIAAYEQAAAQYRQTVLQAFQNVADTLRALETDARALQAQTQAEVAARNALSLTQKQFKLGGVSYLLLLNAQRQYQQAKINRIQAQAARFTDTAALFQALGGSWTQ